MVRYVCFTVTIHDWMALLNYTNTSRKQQEIGSEYEIVLYFGRNLLRCVSQ